ncbi:unnamed protein product [Linum trigynum]|uniref:UBC core domain-containing protein n=1 Tax=Linum trigynum TaxID=586398 RepID=A0AAV2EJJ1_9ROSI
MEDGNSDSDFDVIEISPASLPPSHLARKRKRQQAVLLEIIDVDDKDDVVILNEDEVRRKFALDKGKAIKDDDNAVNLVQNEALHTSLWNLDGKEDTFFYPTDFASLQSSYPSLAATGVEASQPNTKNSRGSKSRQKLLGSTKSLVKSASKQSFPMMSTSVGLRRPNMDCKEILRKWKLFKHFDLVEDYSDHYYSCRRSSSEQRNEKKWAKAIQDEWKRLKKDLPDTTIYVRAYESRMDLLRAVIVGVDGTPYHDGLFFFDLFFPDLYPDVPPEVHLDDDDSLLLNPIFNHGYVCLSLLYRRIGGIDEFENWQPGVSSVMQILLSLQALVLCEKPFYTDSSDDMTDYEGITDDEYTMEDMITTIFRPKKEGKKEKKECIYSLHYSIVFLESLQLMVRTMRKPPKNFKEFVRGHFHSRAKGIVAACNAYMSGVQVGRWCVVKNGEGAGGGVGSGKSCRPEFRDSLAKGMDELMKALTKIGVKNFD